MNLRLSMRGLSAVAAISLAACCVGCGGGPTLCAVGGDIKNDGKPIGMGRIVFTSTDPKAVPPAHSATFSGGHYEMTGVPAGSYQVSIQLPANIDPPPTDIPEKYQKPGTSGLTAEIKAGERNTVNVDIKP